MKKHFKKNRWIYTCILLCFLLITAIKCKKETSYPDYRMKYCGNFLFKTVYWYSVISGNEGSDTVFYKGVISKLSNSDSLIFIRYSPWVNNTICTDDSVFGAHIEPKLYENGELSYNRIFNCGANSDFTGSFHGLDTVIIDIRSGGQGMKFGDKITGVRIK